MKVSKKYIDAAAYGILTAFYWADMPEGANYWCDVYQNLLRLGAEDCAGKAPVVARSHLDEGLARETGSNLAAAFHWKKSPQGRAYWVEVWMKLKKLGGVKNIEISGVKNQSKDDPVDAYDRAMGVV